MVPTDSDLVGSRVCSVSSGVGDMTSVFNMVALFYPK